MSNVAVTKVKQNGAESPSLLEQMKALAESVRQRAYELFQHRRDTEGSALDDWLRAERELIWAPESDLVVKNGNFQVRIAMPGFDSKDVCVTAFPDGVTVRGESTHKHEKIDGDVCFCEFGEKTLFRRFDFPSPIDVVKVTAFLEKGVLHVSAVRRETAPQKLITAAA